MGIVSDLSKKKIGYRPQAEDTSLEADMLEFSLLRSRTPVQRYTMAITVIKRSRQLSLQSLKKRFPNLTGTVLARKIARAWLQENCPVDFVPGNNQTMWIQDPLEIAFLLHNLFESIQVDYFITGGAAAILYGEPRTTRDIDVAIAIQPDRLDQAITLLERSGFYVAGIEDVKTGRLNVLQVIHTDTIARADLILIGETAFDVMQLERRQAILIEEGRMLYYATPEDVVLSKLQWRQQSQSEKQWRDVLGILKVQLELLDREYLKDWANHLAVISELRQAFMEAGGEL